MLTIAYEDLTPFVAIDQLKAEAMIDDALAIAAKIAPCLFEAELSDTDAAAAKAIVRGAIIRWEDSGAGVRTQQQAGPFGVSMDTRQQRRGMFWPSEITDLQEICFAGNDGAFDIDTTAGLPSGIHTLWCASTLGADYCDCGASIAGYPLYGV